MRIKKWIKKNPPLRKRQIEKGKMEERKTEMPGCKMRRVERKTNLYCVGDVSECRHSVMSVDIVGVLLRLRKPKHLRRKYLKKLKKWRAACLRRKLFTPKEKPEATRSGKLLHHYQYYLSINLSLEQFSVRLGKTFETRKLHCASELSKFNV